MTNEQADRLIAALEEIRLELRDLAQVFSGLTDVIEGAANQKEKT